MRLIKRRFDYIDSFRTTSRSATNFHRELATMPYLSEVVTTNWDLYFERHCRATPFVSGRDFAFHDLPGRRVYKIHGSIDNLSSLVITQHDYEQRLDELRGNVLGGSLRQLLATNIVVFVGYSLRDWNFRQIYRALLNDLAELAPSRFIVSPFEAPDADEFGLRHIKTSGVRFLRDLKARLVGDCFIDDGAYDRVGSLRDRVFEAHLYATSLNASSYPALVHCWSYQYGVLDACDRIITLRSGGEYSDRHHVMNIVRTYEKLYDSAIEDGRYWDAAYIDGYTSGIFALLFDDDAAITTPLYFCYGTKSAMRQRRSLIPAMQKAHQLNPKAWEEADRLSRGVPDGMVLPHDPFLPDVADMAEAW